MILTVDNLLRKLDSDLKSKIENLDKKPKLCTIRIGKNEGAISYEKSVLKRAKILGIDVETKIFDSSVSNKVIENLILEKNLDKSINGILIFSPAENHNIRDYFNLIDIKKDVDGQNDYSIINLFSDKDYTNVATTALATLEYLKSIIKLEGKDILIINRSKIIGLPLSIMLQNENSTVTIAHSKTKNIYDKISKSDIVISAIGKAKILKTKEFKKDAIIIDIGYSFDENGVPSGDFDDSMIKDLQINYLPSVGGIGKINSNIILRNTYINEVKNEK